MVGADGPGAGRSHPTAGFLTTEHHAAPYYFKWPCRLFDENPEAAAALAMESLQDGISFGFQQVLIRIQEKNVQLSQRVFRAALSRLKTAGMLDPNELLILYAYLYTPGRIIAANTDGNTGPR